jgi:DNA polymerase I-like protein with 3'-5' exonuclease and polymerase domains
MIYFVTKEFLQYRKSIDTSIFKDILVLSPEEGIDMYFENLSKHRILSLDTETTGLDAYKNEIILTGIGTKQIQFMFDHTVDITIILKHIKKYNTIILGHNLQFDIKMLLSKYKVLLTRVFDTMLAEQRIWMRSGYRFGYADLIERYLKRHIFKSVRNEFIGVDIKTFKINPSHLYYLRGDLVDLFPIRTIQQQYLKKFKMEFLVYGIEFPLISIIAKAELEGFVLDVPLWLERLKKEKESKLEIEIKMDEELRYLRDFASTNNLFTKLDPKIALGGIKYNKPRVHNPDYDIFKPDGTTTNLNIFGEPMTHAEVSRVKKKVVMNPNNISWNAKKEFIYIFAVLEEPLPTPLDTYKIPQLDNTGKLIGTIHQFTIEEDALLKYVLLKPNSTMIDLIKLKLEHSKLEKSINTYGENFINKINPISGKIHTSLRQCFADTGRMQSGGGKKEPEKINIQNIPAKPEYRMCFTTNTTLFSIDTADYGGAELLVMASHAQDHKLIELSHQDMHSYMATKSWKNVFAYRATQLLKLFNKNASYKTQALLDEYNKNVALFKDYFISKSNNKEKRGEFKGMTFGCIYGMYSKRAGAVLNITKEEGQVVLNTISNEIPKTIAMVKRASLDAEIQGFVILNNRTNSRAWFPTLIRLIKKEISKDTHFMEISIDLSAARNVRIQGTQADFVKEASVVLDKYFVKNNINALIIAWVHDEIVSKHPKLLDGVSDEWKTLIETNKDFKLPPYKGKVFNNLQDLKKEIMIEVANRYLVNVEIDVDITTNPYWIK